MSERRLGVVGISHHTAPLEVRERLAFPDPEARIALRELADAADVHEAVLLSTCNRTELYVHGDSSASVQQARALLEERARRIEDEVGHYLYERTGRDAVRHLFRVVTSLDSMVLGEAQIQGQVKGAYESARTLAEPVTGPILSRLFEHALRVGGTVRSRTALGVGAASVPSAAVQLAKKIFGSLEGRRALILGAGEMSELALDCLRSEGTLSVVVANRTEGRARELVERTGGSAIRFEDIASVLPDTDIIASATSAPHAMLTEKLVREALPKGARTPLCILDMALPRDVEPGVGSIHNVFLYDLDDLRQIVDDNLAARRSELPLAEQMIDEAVAEYWQWYAGRHAGPAIRELRASMERQRVRALERMLARMPDLPEAERAAIDAFTRQMMNRMLHTPTVRLRQAAADGNGSDIVHAARYLFALDETDTHEDEDR